MKKQAANKAIDSYVILGQSGLRVSPYALGTITFGEDRGWGASVGESDLPVLVEPLPDEVVKVRSRVA